MVTKDLTRKCECGCIYKREGTVWSIKEFCEEHKPNYTKRSSKMMHRINKKTGRGYTKSPKPIEKRKGEKRK